jgi:hypothetical protein
MAPRLDLHEILLTLTPNVYFQPPATMQMEYPCIVYQNDNARTEFAGNRPYMYSKRYQITVIDRNPDSTIPDSLAWLENTLFDRHFTANNLHHSVFTLFF